VVGVRFHGHKESVPHRQARGGSEGPPNLEHNESLLEDPRKIDTPVKGGSSAESGTSQGANHRLRPKRCPGAPSRASSTEECRRETVLACKNNFIVNRLVIGNA